MYYKPPAVLYTIKKYGAGAGAGAVWIVDFINYISRNERFKKREYNIRQKIIKKKEKKFITTI